MSQQVTLKASRISKSFPGVKALQDVEIELHAGSIHALLREWSWQVNTDQDPHRCVPA